MESRKHWRKVAAWAGGLVLLGGIVLWFSIAPIAWYGSVSLRVDLRILDLRTGVPIADATGLIVLPEMEGSTYDLDRLEMNHIFGRSDSKGVLRLRAPCGAGGSGRFGTKTGNYSANQRLVIEAKGYHTMECALATLAGGVRHSLPVKPVEQDIWLVPIESVKQ